MCTTENTYEMTQDLTGDYDMVSTPVFKTKKIKAKLVRGMKNAYKKKGKNGVLYYLKPFVKPEEFNKVTRMIYTSIP